MIDYKDRRAIKGMKQNMAQVFETPAGQEVMRFLEQSCGWYESVWDPMDRDRVLINAGRREVLATIKTFLEQPPEAIQALAQQKESE